MSEIIICFKSLPCIYLITVIFLFLFRPYVTTKNILIAGVVLATVVLSIIAVCSVYGTDREVAIQENEETPPDPETPLPPSWSKLRVFKRGAVCADGAPCAVVGKYV